VELDLSIIFMSDNISNVQILDLDQPLSLGYKYRNYLRKGRFERYRISFSAHGQSVEALCPASNGWFQQESERWLPLDVALQRTQPKPAEQSWTDKLEYFSKRFELRFDIPLPEEVKQASTEAEFLAKLREIGRDISRDWALTNRAFEETAYWRNGVRYPKRSLRGDGPLLGQGLNNQGGPRGRTSSFRPHEATESQAIRRWQEFASSESQA